MSYVPARCPKCGSEHVREWGRVDIAYNVRGIDGATGDIDTGDSIGDLSFDGYAFDELRCGDCDYASSERDDFLPKPLVTVAEGATP